MYYQADEEIMKMTDALYDKVNTVSDQTSAAITEQAERESAQLKEFYGYIDSRLEQLEASTPAPVVLQAAEEPTDSAAEEEETESDAELALERAREVLAEKAMVYADLKAQYNAAVKSQVEADIAQAKAALAEAAPTLREKLYEVYTAQQEQIAEEESEAQDALAKATNTTLDNIDEMSWELSDGLYDLYQDVDAKLAELAGEAPVDEAGLWDDVLVMQAVDVTTTAETSSASNSTNSTMLDSLKEALAEKVAVYADLQAEYDEAVHAQVEADLGEAKSVLDNKIADLKDKIAETSQDAADQVDEAMSLAGQPASSSSGSTMLYGSLAFFAVAGFAAFATQKKQEKAQVEALISEQDPDEEFQQA